MDDSGHNFDSESEENARLHEIDAGIGGVAIREVGGRKRCPNCNDRNHKSVQQCPHELCWRCLGQLEKGPNARDHECRGRECLRGTFERSYLHFLARLRDNPESGGMPEGIIELSDRFNSLLHQHKTSIADIQIETQQANRIPNALVAPMWLGAFNGFTLRQIAQLFYYEKINGLGKIKFVPNQMRARKVNIGKKGYFETELLFDVNLENGELKGLLYNMGGDSLLTVNKVGGMAIESEMQLRTNGQELVVRMRGVDFLNYNLTRPENACLQRHCSLSFDFGGAPIKEQIGHIDALINMKESLIRPKCLFAHMKDFNAPMQEETADFVRNYTGQLRNIDTMLNELLRDIDPNLVLENNQRLTVLAALQMELSGIQGPPGCGKTFVMAIIVIAQACLFNRTCLILTSRNHTADDIVNKVVELIEKMSENARAQYGVGNLKDFAVRSFPKRRLDSATKGVKMGFASKEDKDHAYSKFRIVVSTVGHAHSKPICQYESNFLCIDEAGLLNPVEFYSILGARLIPPFHLEDHGRILTSGERLNFDQLCVVGDFTQMRSRFSNYKVFSEKLTFDTGMDVSFLERMIRNQTNGHQLVRVLNRCRRGPAPIYKPVFDLWYKEKHVEVDEALMKNFVKMRVAEGKTRSCLSMIEEKAPMNSVYIQGPQLTDVNADGSRINARFMQISIEVIQSLIERGMFADGTRVLPQDITYCTFYKAQYLKMEEFFKRQQFDVNLVFVRTVDQMQGLQNRVVVLDCVRSGTGLGFLDGQRAKDYGSHHNGRIVVALSRATDLRIVICNANKMPAGCDLRRFEQNQMEVSKICPRTHYLVVPE